MTPNPITVVPIRLRPIRQVLAPIRLRAEPEPDNDSADIPAITTDPYCSACSQPTPAAPPAAE